MSDLSQAALHALADKSGVPFNTLVKIRSGYTPNPGIETVRKFYDLIGAVSEDHPPVRTKDAS